MWLQVAQPQPAPCSHVEDLGGSSLWRISLEAREADWFTSALSWHLIFPTFCHPTVSRSCVSPLPYRPLDLRWRLFQRNSRTLIRNRPGLMDGRKLAPASRSEGVILNYSDLLGGSKSEEDLGACLLARHVAVSPSNLRPTLPLLSTSTAVCSAT